jgi:hypothetical protein
MVQRGTRNGTAAETELRIDREICVRRVQRNANERHKSTRTIYGATKKRTQMNVTRAVAPLTAPRVFGY